MPSAAVRLQTELDENKSRFTYQFMKTMTKLEKQNNHLLHK